jgi:dolichol-phosphate mannosyltransferase
MKGVHTYTSFYRAHSARLITLARSIYKDKLIEESGFVAMAEMLVKMRGLPIRITEVPLILRCDLRSGQSKLKVIPTIKGYLRMMLRIWFRPHRTALPNSEPRGCSE